MSSSTWTERRPTGVAAPGREARGRSVAADGDAAGEAVEGEEAVQSGQRQPVVTLDVPAGRAGPGADRQVGEPVAVAVVARHAHPVGEAGEGQEALAQRAGAAVEGLDVPARRARTGPDDHVREA